ncbi:MAG TPA: bile acid:sodium symporter [Acidimicrobiales bacterium]|jgi:bile acid:Na+ symporter, BASS family|nr:bile acid:sodium symporter [Acidimicrobiales bacterium]HRA33305.1 bile acid:sodium symporter [Acidimicrobiales bacterium]
MGELYIDHEYWITFVQLAMAMFAMGATLHVHDFQAVIRLPRSFLTGLVAQMVAVPLVTYLLLRSFDLDPGLAIGLAILAAVPGGTVSNVFTYAGRGDVPLSIALTAVTSLACVVTVPVVLEWLVGSHVPPTFSLPRGRIALEIVATLLVPLAVGMVVLRRWPSRAEGLSRGAMAVTTVLIGVIVVGSALAGRLDAEAMGAANLAVVAGFALLFAGIGVVATTAARRPRPDLTAITIETTVRNTNLGLLVRTSVFGSTAAASDPVADLALFTLLAYAGISIALTVPLILSGRRTGAAPATTRRPGLEGIGSP